jgi:hypothetical protein
VHHPTSVAHMPNRQLLATFVHSTCLRSTVVKPLQLDVLLPIKLRRDTSSAALVYGKTETDLGLLALQAAVAPRAQGLKYCYAFCRPAAAPLACLPLQPRTSTPPMLSSSEKEV